MLRRFTLALVLAPLANATQDSDAPRVLNDPSLGPRIDAAIDRGIEHLLERQHRDGSWTGQAFRAYKAGPTAFAAFALVESGVGPESPSIRAALDYLDANRPTMTYSAGAVLLLLAEIGGDDYEDLAQDCLDRLIEWESGGVRGTWSYPSGPVDLSNMQFVALGFWSAKRLGLDVPNDVVQRLVEATIDQFQEEPFEIDVAHGHEGRRKPKAAGFHYFLERESRPPSASMTAAGVAIQRIAREITGKKLGRSLLRVMDESEELGLHWLGEHWSVTDNHGHHEEGQVLFYLYSLERLGALYGSETIEGHEWYEPGARTIVGLQKEDGGWGRLHETDYALLFLNRATGASRTGESARRPGGARVLDSGPVHVRATGRSELVAWITGIELDAPFQVVRVAWSVDGELRETIEREPGSPAPWKGERFAFKWTGGSIGEHVLEARVTALDENGGTIELESERLTFECRLSADEWFARSREGRGENLIAGIEITAEASSSAAGQEPARAVDGYEGTAWIGGGEPAPRIDLKVEKGMRARAVTLSPAASCFAGRGDFAGVERIRLTVNGKSTEHDLDPGFPGTTVVPLAKRTKVRTISVEILAPTSGRRGFAEIGLR